MGTTRTTTGTQDGAKTSAKAKKRTSKKTSAKKTSAKTTSAKKRTGKKAAAKTTSAKKKTGKKAAAKTASAKKRTGKKAAAKTTSAKKKKAAAKTAGPKKKKTTTKKKAGPAPLREDELLSRTLGAIAEVPAYTWIRGESPRIADEIAAAMRVCAEAGRVDLALQICAAVPTAQRGRTEISLALAGGLDPAVAVEGLLRGFPEVTETDAACEMAAFALRALPDLCGVDRAPELLAAADAAVEACFVAEAYDYTSGLDPLVQAYLALGEVERVASMMRRVPGELPSSLAAGVWALGSSEAITARITRGNADSVFGSPAADLQGWSLDEIARAADIAMGTWARPHLAKLMVESGRVAEARALLVDDPEWETLMLTWKVERYLVVGDRDAARTLLQGEAPVDEFMTWAKMQVEFGIRGFDELWPLAGKRAPESSVMSAVDRLIDIVGAELDAGGAAATVEDAVAAIEALFADPFRTRYDRGVEGSRRTRFASLRARIQIADGNLALAQAELEADWRGISSLLGYAKDAYARNLLLRGFARRAAEVERPDIALKAGKKVPKSYRPGCAGSIARSFLPGDPRGALAAVDGLAKEGAAKALLDGGGLLAGLWSSVLAASPSAAV